MYQAKYQDDQCGGRQFRCTVLYSSQLSACSVQRELLRSFVRVMRVDLWRVLQVCNADQVYTSGVHDVLLARRGDKLSASRECDGGRCEICLTWVSENPGRGPEKFARTLQ